MDTAGRIFSRCISILPFANDEEFRHLHAAIRVVLPLIRRYRPVRRWNRGKHLPGWITACATTAIISAGYRRFPGKSFPEPVSSIEDYHRQILAPMYEAIAPHDPDNILAD